MTHIPPTTPHYDCSHSPHSSFAAAHPPTKSPHQIQIDCETKHHLNPQHTLAVVNHVPFRNVEVYLDLYTFCTLLVFVN